MGCLNSQGQFSHWFGNIHFSGKCNRTCYFCIGQHMQGLDPIDNLDEYPLKGMSEFLEKCHKHGVKEINFTGSDTDPLLYKHLVPLCEFLRENIPEAVLGLRTNAVLEAKLPELVDLFDKGSISITTFDPALYKQTMGQGSPPDVAGFIQRHPNFKLKLNVVLCPETLGSDLWATLNKAASLGIKRLNLREPYGQARIGDPLEKLGMTPNKMTLGMPTYAWLDMEVTYWDVHYVEVESVNLYANGLVSETYPVTAGHHPDGFVLDQSNFSHGRSQDQWKNKKKLTVFKDPVKLTF